MNPQYFIKTVPADSSELCILQRVSHPHIIKIRSFEKEKNQVRLFFEHYPKSDLERQIKQRVSFFKESTVRAALVEMLEALAYLHSNQIMHRDIKPHNILISNSGDFILADFGSAKICNETRNSVDRMLAQTCTGTPLYIAPEVIESRQYSEKTDIYSLGVTIIEMMQLRNPFIAEKEQPTFMQIIDKVANSKFELSSEFWSYSAELTSVVLNMVAKAEQDRENAEQLLSALGIQKDVMNIEQCNTEVDTSPPPLASRQKLTHKEIEDQIWAGEQATRKYYQRLYDEQKLLQQSKGEKIADATCEQFQFWAKLVLLE